MHAFKTLLFIAGILGMLHTANAQKLDTIYIGTATLHDGSVMTYKLMFQDSSGVIKGYSVSDINGEAETKAAITGTINSAGNQIMFKETNILSTKTKTASPDFCIMQGSLKVKSYRGTKIMKGHFEGYLNGGTSICASGKLMLICPKDALKILNKAEEDDPTDTLTTEKDHDEPIEPAPQKRLVKTENAPVPTKPIFNKDTSQGVMPVADKKPTNTLITYEQIPKNIAKVLPGKSIEIPCHSKTQDLEIWDNKDIDGDIITLMQGNTALIKNLSLTGNHYLVHINIGNKQTDTLTLIAVSEGTEPLNTARIKISNGDAATYLDASTTIDKNVFIVLRRR